MFVGGGPSHAAMTGTVISPFSPPPVFCTVVLKLTAFMMTALGQVRFNFIAF
jgi:hypothetical protein